jgi:hypothetical protein
LAATGEAAPDAGGVSVSPAAKDGVNPRLADRAKQQTKRLMPVATMVFSNVLPDARSMKRGCPEKLASGCLDEENGARGAPPVDAKTRLERAAQYEK